MSESLPLVSVCIPIYNAQATIGETLDSIVRQAYQNLEILVLDNASSDCTLEVVRSFSDPRIAVYGSETNIGAEANFTRSIQLAKGKYTAIYHADDVYETDMVEKQVDFLEANPVVGAVFTEARLIDEAGRIIGATSAPRLPKGNKRVAVLDFSVLFKAILLHANFLLCPSAMLRTAIYQNEIGHWRHDLFDSSADLDVWLRVAERHPIGILRAPLMRYRITTTQWTHAVARMRTNRADFFRVTDYYLNKDKTRALLVAEDYRHYSWLERSDRVIRAMNFFLGGQIGAANELTQGVFSSDALLAALRSSRGLKTLLLGGFLKLAMMLHLIEAGKSILLRARGIARK
ncbi:MAG: hypothetical protein CO125_01490 [Hydrogenophilales bacterium CG_4_9_14_3_um_filter_59_35]|nr:MAG: hypothetical protein COW70_04410 [Hydrogenophilales bacterium CG18_big_fil_WC_8_21_14_2_50_58_12]PIY01669.1 MAG: hypothetical protein COZ23_01925 [Hydrogenophilales bacterium CG_4_10_14_3_um_filter_58_23]PJB08519.1 MAG: hypothetical protein CO125_01490 [Hydrogenophilales bacterium CG_4_9_14_3_um_filter_59_35]